MIYREPIGGGHHLKVSKAIIIFESFSCENNLSNQMLSVDSIGSKCDNSIAFDDKFAVLAAGDLSQHTAEMTCTLFPHSSTSRI